MHVWAYLIDVTPKSTRSSKHGNMQGGHLVRDKLQAQCQNKYEIHVKTSASSTHVYKTRQIPCE